MSGLGFEPGTNRYSFNQIFRFVVVMSIYMVTKHEVVIPGLIPFCTSEWSNGCLHSGPIDLSSTASVFGNELQFRVASGRKCNV